MKNMTLFQLVLTGAFGFFIVIGVVVFALFRGSNSGPVDQINVWGTLSSVQFSQIQKAAGIDDDPTLKITYFEINPETFDQNFIETLARGQSPDIIFLPQDSLIKHRNKLLVVPYDTYAERTFRSTFVPQGELFLSSEGVLAFPFSVDPLVMYWNRTLFTNAGISLPPKYWDEFYNLTGIFVEKNEAQNITQSAIAFGEYQNVTNAKTIISTIIQQAGSPVTRREGQKVRSVLGEKLNEPIVPAEAAVNYYTEFSNPAVAFYSWNRSLPTSQDFFTAGDLAVYFGFASELPLLNAKNPNLNFDVAIFPQSRDPKLGKPVEVITGGRMIGLAIPRASKKASAAFRAISLLTGKSAIEELVLLTNLPPVRRDVLSEKPSDPFMSVFYDSALWARGWYDPDKSASDSIFKNMIESITSGKSRISEAVQNASGELQRLLSNVEI